MGKNLGNINEVLAAQPELNKYVPEQWQSLHEFLSREGFSSRKFTEMISNNPKLLTIPKEQMLSSLIGWRSYQFGQKETIKLLERFPELLNVQPSKQITSKIDTLINYVGGGSHIFQLLMNSPTIISQPLSSINEKIKYLKMVMKVSPLEVYKSAVFSLDLFDLKSRHIFMKRLGLYITKKKPDEDSKNLPLYQITDTSDKRFATKVCYVTLDEFETFQELYKRELEKYDVEYSDDEDYDDDDVQVKDNLPRW